MKYSAYCELFVGAGSIFFNLNSKKSIRPIIKYHGGKGRIHKKITKLFPQRVFDNYLLSDMDCELINLYKTFKNKPNFDIFNTLIKNEKYTEENFLKHKAIINTLESFNYGYQRALSYFCVCRMSRGGMRKDFAWSERLRGNEPGDLHAWKTIVNKLDDYNNILQRSGVQVKVADAISVLSKTIDRDDYLFYLDPPYYHETRVSKSVYEHEMTNEQHENFLKECIKHKGKLFISGYDCKLYCDYLGSWEKHIFNVKNNAGQTKVKSNRKEIVWSN